MSESDIVNTISDLEKCNVVSEDISILKNPATDDNCKPQSIEELFNRARQINSNGKFIFSYFSELSTFLLLQLQGNLYRMQKKLHDSIEKRGTWSDKDSTELLHQLKQYRIILQFERANFRRGAGFTKALNCEHLPFNAVQNPAEFVSGGLSPSHLEGGNFAFASSAEVDPKSTSIEEFVASDYVNICPQKSHPIHVLVHKIFPRYFRYNFKTGKIEAFCFGRNGGMFSTCQLV